MRRSSPSPRVSPISLVLLLALLPQTLASPNPIAKAEPEALPIPAPIPEALPLPAPLPIAEPEPEPEAKAEPQGAASCNANVCQFSGAIYINGNGGGTYSSAGGSYQSASPAQCPSSAPISCTNLGEPNWCCPSGNTCGWASNQVVGCCPSGETCSGTVGGYNQGGTTTSYYAPATTTYYSNPGTTVYVGGPTTSYYNPGTATVFNGYCSTIIAHGPGLPTTAAGPCGTVLVIAGAEAVFKVSLLTTIGLVFGGLLVTWRMGGWG